jgi:hypothetical protein
VIVAPAENLNDREGGLPIAEVAKIYRADGDTWTDVTEEIKASATPAPAPVSPVTPVKAEPTFRAIAGRPAIVDNETGDIRIDEDGTVLLDRGPAVPPIIVSRDPDAVLSTSEFNVTLDEETEADVEQARVLRTTIGGRPTPRPIERPAPASTFVRDDGSIVTSFSGERGPVAAVTDFVSEGETEAGDLFVTVKDRETGSEFELHGDDALAVAVARRDTARDAELTEAVTASIPEPALDFDRVLVRMIGPKANLLAVVDRIGTERIVSQQRLDAALDELTALNTEIENENFPEDIRTRLLGVVDDAFNDIATVRARVRQRPEAPADRGTPAPATPLTGGTEETVDRAPAESPASNQITESSLDSPPESVETGAMPQVDSPGMTRRQEALDAGLDRRTADGLGAAVDLGNMMRELAARTPEQVRQDHEFSTTWRATLSLSLIGCSVFYPPPKMKDYPTTKEEILGATLDLIRWHRISYRGLLQHREFFKERRQKCRDSVKKLVRDARTLRAELDSNPSPTTWWKPRWLRPRATKKPVRNSWRR